MWCVGFVIMHALFAWANSVFRYGGRHLGREGGRKRQTETGKEFASWMPDSVSTSPMAVCKCANTQNACTFSISGGKQIPA